MSRFADWVRRKNLLPHISDTERDALDAGTVWLEADLFRGRPDWAKILESNYPQLNSEEQRFLDHQVETLCHMIDDWSVNQQGDLPQEAVDYICRERFLGLMIPKEYGGLGFSNLAFSTILNKLNSRNAALCFYVLIPNSVGPGELLQHYGTDSQKAHYLPKLAAGEYIPCFGLTEPLAGSDAVSIRAEGVVEAGDKGPQIRLNFDKRYITLAPVSNLIGLAFKLHDPDNLLGQGVSPGITVALLHKEFDGVEIGERHDPMGLCFPNGPIRGRDVVISAEQIIGGPQQAGRGWRMLMEALSGGRAISLPAQSTGGAKQAARVASAYAVVREQFGVPIAAFEGIQEPLARLAGRAYMMDAARVFLCSAVDDGHRPSVASAMIKLQHTELYRQSLDDAMDILAGRGIMRGSSNPLGDLYRAGPIGITVEGANILTRTLIVFGQGAIRCHPYAQAELAALESGSALRFFGVVFKHAGYFARNLLRSWWHSATRGRFAKVPEGHALSRSMQKISWASARFSVLADLALMLCGPNLKRKGRLSGRLADAMGWLFLAMSVVRRHHAERALPGNGDAGDDLARWSIDYALTQYQRSVSEIYRQSGSRKFIKIILYLVDSLTNINAISRGVSDRDGERLAALLSEHGAKRDYLLADLYQPQEQDEDAVLVLEEAFAHAAAVQSMNRRLRRAQRQRPEATQAEWATMAGLSEQDLAEIQAQGERVERVTMADSERREDYFQRRGGSPTHDL
ncbi:acyl-coenzyme A dehydrogenase [gamma proteobacterium HTCC5015]|nr:acyl-coenzyme A dehydrogenase [gamma proteobacterium HTCC5015]